MSEQLYTKQQITDFQINHSSAKQMYSFSKAERFPPVKRSGCDKFFLLPPIKHSRCAGFGFGNKYDFTKVKKGNNPEFYSVKRDFDKDNLKGPCYSFGAARETYEKVYYETNKTVDKNIPGPGKYLPKPIKTAPSYTIGVRDKSFGQTSRRARDGPGPGAYPPAIQINQQGKYPSSRFKNITSLSFGSPTSQRFKYKDPGPGAYMVFSEFSIYGPKRKKKVEKKEENEYQENEEEKVSDHDNEDHKQEEENQQQEDKAKSENEQKENENENKKEENINENKDEQQVEEKENENKEEQQIEEKTNENKEEQQIEEKENTKNDEQHVEEKQNENQNEPQIEEKANNKKDNEPIEGEYQDNEENNNAN